MSQWYGGSIRKLERLLSRLGPNLSPRQLRLFACACCRWLDQAGRYRAVMDLAERFADGRASKHELAAARFGGRFRAGHPAWAVCWGPESNALIMTGRAVAWVAGQLSTEPPPPSTGAFAFLHDITGDL